MLGPKSLGATVYSPLALLLPTVYIRDLVVALPEKSQQHIDFLAQLDQEDDDVVLYVYPESAAELPPIDDIVDVCGPPDPHLIDDLL